MEFLNLRKKCKHVTQWCGPGPPQPLSPHSGSQGPGRTKAGRGQDPTLEKHDPTLENHDPTLEKPDPTLENPDPTLENRDPTLENRDPALNPIPAWPQLGLTSVFSILHLPLG